MSGKSAIGIKYCGGCNPYYDRADVAAKLRKRFPEAELSYFNADETYRAILVLHGCSVRCTDLTQLTNASVLIHMDQTVPLEDIEAKIRELL